MAIDSSIPLAANPPADFLTQQQNQLTLQSMMQKLAQQRQATQGQNQLRALFQRPDSVDPSGNITPSAIGGAMRIDPSTGMELQRNALMLQGDRAKIQDAQLKRNLDIQAVVDPVRGQALDAYDAVIKRGGSIEAANDAGQRALSGGMEPILSGGFFSDQEKTQATTKFDATAMRQRHDAFARYQAQDNQPKTPEAIALAQFMKENPGAPSSKIAGFVAGLKKDERGAGDIGWQVLTDPGNKDASGNPIQFRYNARDARATTLDGKPYTPTGAAKLGSGSGQFTDKMGSLMAALAEQGVSLPTGFRSKEQQAQLYKSILDRYPDKPVDDIARQIKTGQIEFAAQKKETQTAAGIAGRVEVAQNELTEFIPLVRQASAKVDRTRFVPINRLMQMGEENISDPNLKELRSYIQSTLNAYDVLAARGGTDKDKRAENHKMLTSADGPQALEAGLRAFEKEAEAARRAAIKATKVPELPDTVPGGKPPVAAPSPGAADIKAQATTSWGSYDPDKYDYRINSDDGVLERRKK